MSDRIFLGVLPQVGEKIFPKLNFKKNQIIISFMSSPNHSRLKKLIKKKCIIVRVIPMPPIRIGKGPVVIFPSNKKIKNFFDNPRKKIIRATSSTGIPGNPILFSNDFFNDLVTLKGDIGAKKLVMKNLKFVLDVPLPGDSAIIDLDTDDDWERWDNPTKTI